MAAGHIRVAQNDKSVVGTPPEGRDARHQQAYPAALFARLDHLGTGGAGGADDGRGRVVRGDILVRRGNLPADHRGRQAQLGDDAAEADAVAVLERPPHVRDQHVAAHLGAVRAAEVLQSEGAVFPHFQAGMAAGHGLVGQEDVGAFAPDDVLAELQGVRAPGRLFQPGAVRGHLRLVHAVEGAEARQCKSALGAVSVARRDLAQENGALGLHPHRTAVRRGRSVKGQGQKGRSRRAGQKGRPQRRGSLGAQLGEGLAPNGPVVVSPPGGRRQDLVGFPEFGERGGVVQVILGEPAVGGADVGHAAADGHF